MREIQTVFIRLLVETDKPYALRGMLHAVTDDEEHSFADGQSLLALLRRMRRPTGESFEAREGKEKSIQGDEKSYSLDQESKS